jgi:A/G-specific adenine glycosylase
MRRLAGNLIRWFDTCARDLPWRRTRDPYAVWISEIMLQQTQVKTVIPYYQRWMRALPTIGALARARPERVLKLWEGLGYYGRARRAQAAAKVIMDKHAGQFPKKFDDVLALPGIGRYTAGAVCSIAFNQPAPILDGNVLRVLTRLLGIAGDPRSKAVNARLWRAAAEMVAAGEPSRLNQSLMELGALVCVPRQPDCPACPLRCDCFAWRSGRVEDFPAPSPKAAVTPRRFIVLVAGKGGRFLVRRRPDGVVNAGLWEFPNFEVAVTAKNITSVAAPLRIAAAPFLRLRHSITRYRILLEAFHARLPEGARAPRAFGTWKTPAQMKKLAFASAHRKVLEAATTTGASQVLKQSLARREPRPTKRKVGRGSCRAFTKTDLRPVAPTSSFKADGGLIDFGP